MADVTYADLKFVPNAKKPISAEPRQAGSEPEDEDGEITYENIQRPQITKFKANPEPARTGKEGLSALRLWTPHVALVLLVVCLCLLVIGITLGLKFMQISQQMSEGHEILNNNFSQSMRLRDRDLKDTQNELQESEMKLTETRVSLEQVLQELIATRRQLVDTSRNASETMDKLKNNLETIKKERDELNSLLENMKKQLAALPDCCPQEWNLVGDKCLFISKYSATWEHSKTYCEQKFSRLLIFKTEDPEIKTFLQQNCDECWIGVRIRENYKIWLDDSERLRYDTFKSVPGKIKNGNVEKETANNYLKYICERCPGLNVEHCVRKRSFLT
uniref:B-cell differentiation antigen CD72-like n=1 Tax=Geotrypetes seraphini TaxID=260995 RepID=A0A6P8QEE5_GEOSA|nr:B-cell differentiation antigen CD72-like [Geotrypetes seraphini]